MTDDALQRANEIIDGLAGLTGEEDEIVCRASLLLEDIAAAIREADAAGYARGIAMTDDATLTATEAMMRLTSGRMDSAAVAARREADAAGYARGIEDAAMIAEHEGQEIAELIRACNNNPEKGGDPHTSVSADISRNDNTQPPLIGGGEPHLFVAGEFTAHSGDVLPFKIDCDALTDADLATLAAEFARRSVRFSGVRGIPRGGIRFAAALARYATRSPLDPPLIVDDVLTTGTSMEMIHDLAPPNAIGVVIFARGPCPSWVTPLFQLSEITGHETMRRVVDGAI